MKPFASFIVCAILALSVGCASTRAAAPMRPDWLVANEDLLREGVSSSVLIAAETTVAGGPAFHGGTGTVIDREGHVLTAAHVIAGGRNILVHPRTFDPASMSFTVGEGIPAEIVAAAPEFDAALLRVRDPSALPPPLPLARGRIPDIGETVWFFGKRTACGFGPVIETGIRIGDTRIRTIVVSTPSVSGDSGAPLVLPGVGVVGMLFGSSPDGAPTYFIPVGDVLDALDRERRL